MELETWHAPPGEEIPNHPSFPVLLYRGTGLGDAEAARERFAANGWGASWVDGVFDFHHFHSTSRSEEQTSELQSRQYLVCRLLLEKKDINLKARDQTARSQEHTSEVQ